METLDGMIQQISLALGASWASGINLYAAMLTLGILHHNGTVILPEGLELLGNPLVMGAAGIMFAVEFFADKIPGIDSAWDMLHTFIRIPAGAAMAYGAIDGGGPAMEAAAAIIGGGMATFSHGSKAGSRVLINTSPEPFSNWTASVTEDAAVIGGLWAAVTHPWIFLMLLGLFILLMIWLIPKIWRGIKKVFAFLTRFFQKNTPPEPENPPPAD